MLRDSRWAAHTTRPLYRFKRAPENCVLSSPRFMWWSWFACSADCHLRPGSSVEGFFFSFQRNDLDLTFFDVVVAADDVRCKTDFTSSCKLRFFHRKRSARVDEWGEKGIKRNLNFNRTLNSRKQHVSSAISTCFERDSDEKNGANCFVDGVYVLHSDSR